MTAEIEGLLPHREPFLFVSEIVEASAEQITAKHTFTEKDFFFKGHFPEYPLVPGVILIEAMAQAGGAGLKKIASFDTSSLFFLATIDKAKFRRQVRPGDELYSEIKNVRISSGMIKQKGKAYVGTELAAEAEWMCLVQSAEK